MEHSQTLAEGSMADLAPLVAEYRNIYRSLAPVYAAGVRIRYYHYRLAGSEPDSAMVNSVRDEMNRKPLP